jgi:methylthioribose-1-phosphate isomerase
LFQCRNVLDKHESPTSIVTAMKVHGRHYRTIWLKDTDERVVQLIDQRALPHEFIIEEVRTVAEAARAIAEMHVRGAGLIGAAAGYGMYLAALESARDEDLCRTGEMLKAARPTAVNLAWAVDRQLAAISGAEDKLAAARITAAQIADEDAEFCRRIGQHGLPLIAGISRRKGGAPVNILTHCNAGWLAFVDHGSATAPIYAAHDAGIAVHVWVDETRPRSQGAKLTAWELAQHGVPHTLIVDNAGGHLMQRGEIDLVLVGTDRTTCTGDVANKIGTYLKALAARDNGVPFYVALPSSSFDWKMRDGLREIPIEDRGSAEVKVVDGWQGGMRSEVLIAPAESPAANPGFDVTPARLVTALITERGVCAAVEAEITRLFPEHAL